MWRPDNWRETKEQYGKVHGANYVDFEAGADAYGKALIKQGHYITPATYIDYPPLIASLGAQCKEIIAGC